MSEFHLPSGTSTEIPPPPEEYDPEKPVVFQFKTSGHATLVWDYELRELRYFGKNFAAYKDWQRELFVPTEMECSVIRLTENEPPSGDELESFVVNVSAEAGYPPQLEPPRIGVVLEDFVSNGEHRVNRTWQMRNQIAASKNGLRVGEAVFSLSDLMSSGEWDGLAASETFVFWGMAVDPVELSNWPFPELCLNSAFLLLMDAGYILHHTRLQNRPANLPQLMSDIAAGPGWETLLEMVEQMPEDKRRWINCPKDDVTRMLREVHRTKLGNTIPDRSPTLL